MEPQNNSDSIKILRCPNCFGTVDFVPGKQKIVCQFCGCEFDINQDSDAISVQSSTTITTTNTTPGTMPTGTLASTETQSSTPIQGFDFTQFYEGVKQEDSEDLPIYYCKSCGAEVIAANEEASLTCPYCTNKIVLSNKVSGKFRPDGIIPFKI
nr:hypothetical protein [Lachnospiraceae bacterium]